MSSVKSRWSFSLCASAVILAASFGCLRSKHHPLRVSFISEFKACVVAQFFEIALVTFVINRVQSTRDKRCLPWKNAS